MQAQPPAVFVVIGDISVTGNEKTKSSLILRELFIQSGDSLLVPELASELEYNRLQLMNTGLFLQVELNIGDWDVEARRLDIQVKVVEAWYIYPIPIFELADRNFNTWWKDFDHSLRRINYGLRFYHNNLTGRRDVLKGVAQFGFTNKYEMVYRLPFIDKKQQWGLSFGISYARNKEINYLTLEDHQQFFRSSDHVLLRQFRVGASATLRRKRQVTHTWELNHRRNRIEETVQKDLNPDYFLDGLQQIYSSFSYEFTADTRDIRPYPLHGGFLQLRAQKDGLGSWEDVNALNVSALFKKYLLFSRRWSIELIGAGRLALIREAQPFANSQALGYGIHYIRGYEFYVIDGLDYMYGKTSLRIQLLDRAVFFGDLVPFQKLKKIPYRLYLALNNDMGFANNPFYSAGNPLANNLLWGYGLGLDLVVLYNKVFRLEFSRNRLGENGVFLHWAVVL
ncbi:MAG: BamA/TamA family outer membrane protein [Saprospirales bacterium]|nr:BamA/TamA family outer membrane protein [Saprospirales bacterium]